MSPVRRSPLKSVLLALLGLGAIATCFFGSGAVLLLPAAQQLRGELDRAVRDVVDLGEAEFPPGTIADPTKYVWEAPPLTPRHYAAAYALSPRTATELESDYRAYAERLGFRFLTDERIVFQPPPGCGRDLSCVYAQLLASNRRSLAPLAERFLSRAREARLRDPELATLIVTFVQRLRYAMPSREPFGLLPPALVAKHAWGDCDSKALLAIALLEASGIPSQMLASDSLAHAAVGVSIPGGGDGLSYRGRRYLYAEVTSEGWPIGTIPPAYADLRQWTIVPTR